MSKQKIHHRIAQNKYKYRLYHLASSAVSKIYLYFIIELLFHGLMDKSCALPIVRGRKFHQKHIHWTIIKHLWRRSPESLQAWWNSELTAAQCWGNHWDNWNPVCFLNYSSPLHPPKASCWGTRIKMESVWLQVDLRQRSWTWKSTQLYPSLVSFGGHPKYCKVEGKRKSEMFFFL